VGQLREARQFFQQKKLPAAWGATRAALKHRPFHPEAYLLLAEIALAAQDSVAARDCAQFARQIAPEFRPARKFLKGKLHGHLKPEWLVLPDEIGKHKAESRNWLSVCLIVKNEERFLGQCLASVKGLAHQIVVVDTGSADRTVEIAKEHGAQVHSFAWCDDFSAARNAALEHATGDWVLMLDADEELPLEQHAALRKLLHTPSVISWRLPLQDVGREAEGCSYVRRLYRNAPGLYYAGRVHEQVFTSIEERRAEWGLDTRLGDATLRHHGYTKDLTLERDKVGRNLRLLEQAVLETPGDTNLLMNYGLELTRSGRQEEGLRQYRAAFETMAGRPSAQVVPEMREMLLSQFCTQLMAAKRYAEIIKVLTSPLAKLGGGLTASLHFTLGLAQTELKEFATAADQFRQCLAKRDRSALTPVNLEIRKAGPRHCLALCLEQMGEIGAADEEFRRAIEAEPQARPLRRDYARFLAAHERQADALNLLFALANEKPTDAQVWLQGGQLALTRPEFLEVAVDWTAGAAEHLPDDPAVVQQRAEALMLAGQCGAALPLWRRWPPASNHALAAALVLCETAVGENQFSPEAADEAAVSRQFVKWYQKLLQFNARQTVETLNAKLEVLERTLPSAASILSSALAEAAETVTT
jgi:Tfp pilus assembly protein PilF